MSLVVFLAISVGAVYFGTKNIESDIESRSQESLQAAGFNDVDVLAQGASVHLSGSMSTEQSEDVAFQAVSSLVGVRDVEGKLWPVFSGDIDDIVVTGEALEFNWDGSVVTVEGNVANEDRRTFVESTLSPTFSSVSIDGLTVLEGLEEESGWLGAALGLLIELQPDLTTGKMIVDPNGELLVVAGEVEDKDLRNILNTRVIEVADQLGYSFNPAVRIPEAVTTTTAPPTEEEIEDLQVDLDALLEGKVVEFATKSHELTEKGVSLLDEVIVALQMAPNVRVQIAGHTDSRGSSSDNQQLSEDRANAVFDYLVAKGMPEDRFDVIGYGEDNPTDTNNTAEGRAHNRRIEFIALEGAS